LTRGGDLRHVAGDTELEQGPDREAAVEESLDVQVHRERGAVGRVAEESHGRSARPGSGSRLRRLAVTCAAVDDQSHRDGSD